MRLFDTYPPDWKLVKLSDLGYVGRGRSRHRPRHDPTLYGGEFPFIQTGDIKNSDGRIRSHSQTYNDTGLAQSKLWDADTMCITIAANIAETAILTYPACFPDSVIGFTANPAKASVYFVEYAFRYLKRMIQEMMSDSGTVQDNLNLEFLESLLFPIPPKVGEQERIAEVLSKLDERIWLNERVNSLLERIASKTFRSWFVDFDPVVAKSEGRRPFGMSDDIAALFSDRFHDGIPADWNRVSLSNIASLSRGQVNPGLSPNTVFDHYSIPAFDEGRRPKQETGSSIKSGKFVVPPNSVIISKLNPVTPRVWLPDVESQATSICSTEFMVLTARKGVPRSYLFSLVSSLEINDQMCGLVTGTSSSHQRVKPDDFMRLQASLPPTVLLKAFGSVVDPMLDRVRLNIRQSHALRKLRDAILPGLVSGELRVSKAEALLV